MKDYAGAAGRRGGRDVPRPARLQHANLARSAAAGLLADDRRRRDPAPSASRTSQVAAGRLGQPPVARGADVPFQLVINTQGRLSSEQQFDDIIVKTGSIRAKSSASATSCRKEKQDAGGQVVEKGVELGAKNYDVNSYLDGEPSVTLAVFQLPGSNALKTAEDIKAKMKELKPRSFPRAWSTRSSTTRRSSSTSRSTKSTRPSSRRSSSSSSSCWSSSRTGGRR